MEYARSGTVIKGQERAPVKSKYLEDVFTNNHTVRNVMMMLKSLYTFYNSQCGAPIGRLVSGAMLVVIQ